MALRRKNDSGKTVSIEQGRNRRRNERKYSGNGKEYTKYFYHYDYILLFIVILLAVFGIVMIYSTGGKSLMLKQALVLGIGFAVMGVMVGVKVPPEILRKKFPFMKRPKVKPEGSYKNRFTEILHKYLIHLIDDLESLPGLILVGCYGLQIAVYVTSAGRSLNSSRRWISIAGVQFQPSEVSKFGVIIFVAYLIYNYPSIMENFLGWLEIIIFTGPLIYLIYIENLSSAIIIAAIIYIMIFIASRNKKSRKVRRARYLRSGRRIEEVEKIRGNHVTNIMLILMIFAVAAVIWVPHSHMIDTSETTVSSEEGGSYRNERIKNWKRIEDYDLTTTDMRESQTVQGLSAIASGGLTGKGIGNGIEKLHVQESSNDMILAVIFEELGFIGALIIISFYFLMCWRLFVTGCGAQTMFQSFVCFGVMAQFILQMILNFGVVTNFIPNTGVSLPFISYGGSSLFVQIIEIALVFIISGKVMIKPSSSR